MPGNIDLIKILVNAEIGALEWTPPAELQEKFKRAPPAVRAAAQQWMGRMIEGYICALIDTQRSTAGLTWLEQKTTELVSEAIMLDFGPSAEPASTSQH